MTTPGETPKRRERDPLVPPTHDIDTDPEKIQEIEREAERFRYVPPFAREIVEQREREQKKR